MPIKDMMMLQAGRCPTNVFPKSPLKPVSQHREGNGRRTHEQVCILRVLVAQYVDQGKVTGLTMITISTWDMTLHSKVIGQAGATGDGTSNGSACRRSTSGTCCKCMYLLPTQSQWVLKRMAVECAGMTLVMTAVVEPVGLVLQLMAAAIKVHTAEVWTARAASRWVHPLLWCDVVRCYDKDLQD